MELFSLVEEIKNEMETKDNTGAAANIFKDLTTKAIQGDLKARDVIKERIKLCLKSMDLDEIKISTAIKRYCNLTSFKFLNENIDLIDKLTQLIYQEAYGLSVIDELAASELNEIGTTRYDYIWIQKSGVKTKIPFKFIEEKHYKNIIIDRLSSYQRKHDLNPTNPYYLGERLNGSRITITIPPFSGSVTSNIRNFDLKNLSDEDLIKGGAGRNFIEFLKIIYPGRPNFLIIGGQGVGKSTLLRYMARFIPDNLGIGSIETSFELNLDNYYPIKNIVKLCVTDSLDVHDCFRIMLKQNRDVVFCGEISYPEEAIETLNAMSRMAKGSGGTFHSSSPMDCIYDFKNLLMRSGYYSSDSAALFDVARAIDLIIHLRIDPSTGRRYINRVTEVKESIRDNNFELKHLWHWDKSKNMLIPTGNPISNNLQDKLLDFDCCPENIKDINKILLGPHKEG